MTSFAFILRCMPLCTAEGAGAVSRQIVGTAVIGGMVTALFIAIFLILLFSYLVEKFTQRPGQIKSEATDVDEVGASQAPTTTFWRERT